MHDRNYNHSIKRWLQRRNAGKSAQKWSGNGIWYTTNCRPRRQTSIIITDISPFLFVIIGTRWINKATDRPQVVGIKLKHRVSTRRLNTGKGLSSPFPWTGTKPMTCRGEENDRLILISYCDGQKRYNIFFWFMLPIRTSSIFNNAGNLMSQSMERNNGFTSIGKYLTSLCTLLVTVQALQ